MDCVKCKETINPLRVKALPNTRVCVKCSSVERVSGFMSWEHKTAPTLNICTQEQAEQVRQQTKRVGQSPIAGIRMRGH
jgi:RNA polymerase-binding transcription factor DksA